MLPEESLDYVSDPVIKDEIDDASLSSEENTAGQAIDLSTEVDADEPLGVHLP